MKKKIFLVGMATLLLTACTTQESVEDKEQTSKSQEVKTVKVEPKVKSENTEKKDQEVNEKNDDQVKESIVNIDNLKKIKIGMTKEEVVAIMGNDYKEISFMYDGEAGWSLETPIPMILLDYSDEALAEDYAFEHEMEDAVDIDGIYQKKRGSIAKIRLSEDGIVKLVNSIYLNEKDQKLYEYYLFENSFVKDHVIYPYE